MKKIILVLSMLCVLFSCEKLGIEPDTKCDFHVAPEINFDIVVQVFVETNKPYDGEIDFKVTCSKTPCGAEEKGFYTLKKDNVERYDDGGDESEFYAKLETWNYSLRNYRDQINFSVEVIDHWRYGTTFHISKRYEEIEEKLEPKDFGAGKVYRLDFYLKHKI